MKKSLGIFLTLTLSISVTALSSSFSDEGKNEFSTGTSKRGEVSKGEGFTSVGFRSHGVPTRDWSTNNAQPSTMSLNSPSVSNDSPGSDDSWTSQNFTKTQGTAKVVAVGSNATNPISCHGACTLLTGGSAKMVQFIPVWVGNWDSNNLNTWNSLIGNLVNSYGTTKPVDHVFNTDVKYFTLRSQTMPALSWTAHSNTTPLKSPTATAVADKDVATYINNYIATNNTPVTPGATPVYVYIGGINTRLSSGFGTSYCGWHTYGNTLSGTKTPYIAIQDFNAVTYPGCTYQNSSPNANIALDAMASVLAHEIDETLTDPLLNAWYDNRGAENADKCAWTFGVTTPVSSVSKVVYNFSTNGINYLIQQNWLADNKVTPTGTTNSSACSVK